MSKVVIVTGKSYDNDELLRGICLAQFNLIVEDIVHIGNENEKEVDFDLVGHIVFALPEWNGSYPWWFKKWIDEIPFNSFKNKNASIIAWSSGNNYALSLRYSLNIVLSYLKLNITNNYCYTKK